MYKFKQDLASAYFPDNSKETASKRFAHEIHSNKPLLAALRKKIKDCIISFNVIYKDYAIWKKLHGFLNFWPQGYYISSRKEKDY